MVAKAQERKTSDELLVIATEILLLMEDKYELTWAETSIIIFLMSDGQNYANEAEHIKRMINND